jgi:hypothetical protein
MELGIGSATFAEETIPIIVSQPPFAKIPVHNACAQPTALL